MKKKVLHIILNSHLDPIWLWNMDSGIDEVLATARTACNVLDDYPEVHMTRGEAWFYEMVELHDKGTFERIRQFIAAGRWHVVGNWYVQPDCNLASAETYMKHSEISSAYFRTRFGIGQVRTGYNVDSFGHGAYLPKFYHDAGVENYCFMRPGPHEKELPGEVFWWEAPSGERVLTARLLEPYATNINTIAEHIERAIEKCDPKLGHIMRFCGIGDHGGGPTRAEIDWLMAHRNDYPGVEIRFSHPDAFFDEVRKSKLELPVVKDELQHHAIGCYTAVLEIKEQVRQAENKMLQADRWLTKAERERCWKNILFATFHDVLAGSCIASAYDRIYDMLGESRTIAQNAITRAVRRKTVKRVLPTDCQQLIFDNTGSQPYSGVFVFNPWLTYNFWWGKTPIEAIRIRDEKGRVVPFQLLEPEAAVPGLKHVALPLEVASHGRRVLRLDFNNTDKPKAVAKAKVLNLSSLMVGKDNLLDGALSFQVISDTSDTWTHDKKGYALKAVRRFKLTTPFQSMENGPLVQQALGGYTDAAGNEIQVLVSKEAGLNGLRLHLRVNWHTTCELLKLVLKPSFAVTKRVDGVSGGAFERHLDGEEYPLYDTCWLQGVDQSLAVVSPDCRACDVQPDGTLRLTLLRSPYYANHQPFVVPAVSSKERTEQGVRHYDIILLANPDSATICSQAYRQTEPIVYSETTIGM